MRFLANLSVVGFGLVWIIVATLFVIGGLAMTATLLHWFPT